MRRFLLLVCALTACVGALAAYAAIPSDDDIVRSVKSAPYQQHPNVERSQSPLFIKEALNERNARGDNAMLLLGSSELKLVEPCSSYPSHFFGENNYGMDVLPVGSAFFQNLSQALMMGALGDDLKGQKVVLLEGIQWFMSYQDQAENFRYAFSDAAYDEFMENPLLSDDTKSKLLGRMQAYGVEAPDSSFSSLGDISDALDRAVEDLFDGRDFRQSVLTDDPDDRSDASGDIPEGRFEGAETAPDWDAWMEKAEKEARESTSSNDMGMLDSYWENSYDGWLAEAREYEFAPGEEYSEDEMADFKLFLQICEECEIEPLIILMPVKGEAYDESVYTSDVRGKWYDLMADACEEYGVEYVDFSCYDYDKYFIRDVMHLSWTGWVQTNKAIYEFYRE